MKKILESVLLYIKKTEIVLIVLMAAVIIAVIAAQVFMRYFFNRPFNWAEELATLMLIYLSFISADVVYKEKGHITVDYFVAKLPELVQRVINIVIHTAIIVFFLVMIPRTFTLVRMQIRIITSAAVVVPKSFYTLPVLLVFPSMLLSTVYNLITEVESIFRNGHKASSAGDAEEARYI